MILCEERYNCRQLPWRRRQSQFSFKHLPTVSLAFFFALPGFLVAKTVLQTTAIVFNIIFYHKTDLFWIVAFSRFLFFG
jgi:hypothetical protein